MLIVYLASFIAGLLLAVRIMIYGVERSRDEHPAGERTFRVSPAMISTFTVVFGLTGYLLTRRAVWEAGVRGGVSAALGAVAMLLAARSVRRWWAFVPEHDVDDERYILQGCVARVTKPIPAGLEGEVSFELERQPRVLRAKSIDDGQLALGTEVVIERVEADVAYVEAWAEVEKRL